jgi:phosphatidylethanolamine/phosphatidyl-N-methylethanolamine N-methyltransferase
MGTERTGSRGALELAAVQRAYRRYAPAYDVLFGRVFARGRLAAATRVNALSGRRVLEVGVGTGLALPLYNGGKEIVGVDVSSEMLDRARRRIEEMKLEQVRELAEMDGEELAFEDESFDIVVASYVMSVVPDPHRCLAEMTRVCMPGGIIVICNHFASGPERLFTRRLQMLSDWLGWHPDFTLDALLVGSPLRLISDQPLPPFGLFHLVELHKP